MAAHQAPPSLGFSSLELWSGLPFPSSMRESEIVQSCPTLSDPMDCSLPGSSIHGIFQATVLEWGAIAFSIKEMQIKISMCYNFKLSKMAKIKNMDNNNFGRVWKNRKLQTLLMRILNCSPTLDHSLAVP